MKLPPGVRQPLMALIRSLSVLTLLLTACSGSQPIATPHVSVNGQPPSPAQPDGSQLSAPSVAGQSPATLCGEYIMHETVQSGFGAWTSWYFVTDQETFGISNDQQLDPGHYCLADVVLIQQSGTYDGKPIDRFISSWSSARVTQGAPQLPSFKLPYASNVKVYWTGGPHAYLMGGKFQALYPSGLGSGLDFANGKSFQVLAMAAGKVIDASCNHPGFGCQVAIRHAVGGTVLIYGHLAEGSFAVSPDQMVEQGTILGMAGNTGSGGGPYIHLHVELRDGADRCTHQCLPDQSFGNPIGWDDLVELVDGWRIGGYLADSEGKNSYNYDGSAVHGTDIDVIYDFSNGKLPGMAIVRVHKGFKCGPA